MILASFQVYVSFVQRFQRKARKCISQSEALMLLCFQICVKSTNLVEDVEILLSVKFKCIPFSNFKLEPKGALVAHLSTTSFNIMLCIRFVAVDFQCEEAVF